MPTLTAKTITAKTLTARNIGQGEAAFSLADLFAASEAGAWYDPSDLSTMWQDAARTVAAVVNSPVRVTDDKSGNGNHATAPSDAARPILRESGGLYYLEFDGVDDAVSTTNTDILTGRSVSVSIAAESIGIKDVFTYKNNGIGFSDYTLRISDEQSARWYSGSSASTANLTGYSDGVATLLLDFEGGATKTELYINGSLQDDTPSGATVYDISAQTAGQKIHLSGFPLVATRSKIYGCVVTDGAWSESERNNIEAWLAAKSGVTL